jgi:hypothetical protein
VFGDRAYTALTGSGLHDAVSLALQVQLDQVGDVGFVVDNEDRAAFHRPSIVAFGRRANVRIM